VGCSDGEDQSKGIMIIRLLPPALSDNRPGLRLAGPARQVARAFQNPTASAKEPGSDTQITVGTGGAKILPTACSVTP
jgi:hypothetical protein